jgi:hypothetical protein
VSVKEIHHAGMNPRLAASAQIGMRRSLVATMMIRTFLARIVPRPIAIAHANQDEPKPHEDRDGEDVSCKDESRTRIDRDGRDVSRKDESRPRDDGNTTDQYKIEFRGSHNNNHIHRRKMALGDSDSDLESLEPEPHPRRLCKSTGDCTNQTAEAQLGQPSSKAALGKKTHEEESIGFIREE